MMNYQVIDRIGWALVHSVWLITLVACVVAIVNRLVFRNSPISRYVVGCAGLLLIAVSPIAAFVVVSPSPNVAAQLIAEAGSPEHAANFTRGEPLAESSQLAPSNTAAVIGSMHDVGSAQHDRVDERSNVESFGDISVAVLLKSYLAAFLQPAMPSIVFAWFAGVVSLSLRAIAGLYTVRRLRRIGRSDVAEDIAAVVSRLCDRMGISKTIEFAESALLEVPAVIGTWRLLMLLPASFGTGLTPQQLEAVIAHELAHIRRHDFFVNLLQTVIETVLFYHPGVWLLSCAVRQEREHCCDDIAMSVCKDRAAYAKALLTLDALRSGASQPAIAATGGSLLKRIRRIMQREPDDSRRIWPLGVVVLLITSVASIALFQGDSVARSEDEQANADAYDGMTADLIDQLSSSSQQKRDAAAKRLREVYVPSDRKKWDELLAKTKPGYIKKDIQRRFGIDTSKVEVGIGTGPHHMETYRLDDRWVLSCWFYNVGNTLVKAGDSLREAKLVERMREAWVPPKKDFTGVWTTYFVNGQRSHEMHYKDGKYDGVFTAFHSNGAKSFTQNYVSHVIDGEDTGYFPSGEVLYCAFYKAGKPVGMWTWYEKDGSIRSKHDHGGLPRTDDVAERSKPVRDRNKRISPDAYKVFESNFADTTDANLFGYPNEGGWIYTAESVARKERLVQSRRADVTIAKDEGVSRDCLRFGAKSSQVLYYLMNPSLSKPKKNWSGAVSFWLKPDVDKINGAVSYPLQFFDGDWSHGGFFVRLSGEESDILEFGAVSSHRSASGIRQDPKGLPREQVSVISHNITPVTSNRWTFITLTFENANSPSDDNSIIRLYVDAKLAGQTTRSLKINWMDPDTAGAMPDSATFIGIDYVGDIDEFCVYDQAISLDQIAVLHDLNE